MAALGVSLFVAAALAAVGLLILALRPMRTVTSWLAALLLLQAASTASYAALAATTSPQLAYAYARMGVWASIPLPFVTVCVIYAVLPPPPRHGRALVVGLGGLTLVALVANALMPGLFVARVLPFGAGYSLTSGLLFYVVAALAAASQAYAVWHAQRVAAHANDVQHRQASLAAAAFALLPLHSAAFFVSYTFAQLGQLAIPPYVFRASMTLVAAGVIVPNLFRLLTRLPGPTRRGIFAVTATIVALGLLDGLVGSFDGRWSALPGYERSVAVLRLAFATLICIASLRFGTADMGARERRHAQAAARSVTIVAASLGAAALALVLIGVNLLGVTFAALGIVAVPAAARRPTSALADALTRRLLLPPDDPRAVAERARTYAAAVAAAQGAGPEGERYLAALRQDLGLTEQEHALLVQGVASREKPRYHTVETLGRGATAQVELAVDEVAGKRVVVKRFKGLRDPGAALQEARALAAVRHARVVPFLEVDRRDDELYLVLAYAEGGSARQLLDRDGPLAPERAVALTRDLLEGLEALHAAGIVHCDVKPENLLLDANGRGMLGDFGSARFLPGRRVPDLADATLVGGAAEGSLSTISPEALRGAPPAPARDVYATGAMLYRLLTGEHYVALENATVFEARERILLDAPRLPHPRVPATLEPVLRRALAKRAEDRYQGAREMRDAFEGV